MQDKEAYFLLFPTIHDVLKAEKLLKQKGLSFELVPVPRNLSSDCGMCVKLEGDVDEIILYLGSLNLSRCFYFDGNTYTAREDLLCSAVS